MKVHVPPACAVLLGALLAVLPAAPVLAQDDPPPELVEEQPVEEPADEAADPLERAFFQSLAANGQSHASGGRPDLGSVIVGNPTRAAVVIRIGLHYSFTSTGAFSEFTSRNHPFVRIAATVGTVHVRDGENAGQIAAIEPGMIVDVRAVAMPELGPGVHWFAVRLDDVPLGTFQGPVRFLPTEAGEELRVESIRRANILGGPALVPRYRGALEVARGTPTPAGTVNLVNVIEVESYVPGVVANESPASFHMQALKSQAVAARGYAIANIGRFAASGWPFDILDSSASQVYRGIVAEHPRTLQACAETVGLVGSYQGRIISALYSSSMGGHTENNEWIFPSPTASLPGTNAEPYLRGIYDGIEPAVDVSDPVALETFWKSQQPQTYDSCAQVANRFSRWRIVVPSVVAAPNANRGIKGRLPGRYVVISGNPSTILTGNILDVVLLGRMTASGRAAVVEVTLTTGRIEVRGWENLRQVFGTISGTTAMNCGTAGAIGTVLTNPSYLAPVFNADGTVREVIAWGGGFGHNVGMSQYGAHGRGRAGQTFLQILNAYYTGVDVGSYPIDIGREPGGGPPTLRQTFYAPYAQSRLDIRSDGLKGLRVHVNELYDLSFSEEELAAGLLSVDLGPYIVPGLNTVQYNPVGRNGTATVVVVVD